jgi:hypothetical protein
VPILQRAKRAARAVVESVTIRPLAEIRYGIKAGYRHRLRNQFFDDTRCANNSWQREVYERAAKIAKDIRAKAIADFGCGSGFKLMKYLGSYHTIVYELSPTIEYLRRTHPDRDWRSTDFSQTLDPVDILICADVIEHIPDPDALMSLLHRSPHRVLVLSTPDRLLVYGFDHDGPPRNPAHCREWTQYELRSYVARWYEVTDSMITNESQGTQMIVARPRR